MQPRRHRKQVDDLKTLRTLIGEMALQPVIGASLRCPLHLAPSASLGAGLSAAADGPLLPQSCPEMIAR